MAEDTTRRILELEKQNRAIQAEIAELKSGKSALRPQQPAPVVEEGVTVTYSHSIPIERPTGEQFEKLLAIVARAHPTVVPKFARESDRSEFFRGFVASFERIASLRRTAGLNAKNDAHWWANEAYRWLHERGTPAETTNGSFFAAVIAAGDVPFSFANRAEGVSAYVGLTFDTDSRTAAPAAWRGVIERGQPRPPAAPPTPLRQNQRPAQVRIYE